MITYESARQAAQNYLGPENWACIDTAEEYQEFYVFDDSKEMHAGWIPVMVFKKDGVVTNYGRYCLSAPESWDPGEGKTIPL